MTDNKFNEIENKLSEYIESKPQHPNIRFFAGINGYHKDEVIEVAKKTALVFKTEYERQAFLDTVKPVIEVKVEPVHYHNVDGRVERGEINRKARRRMIKEFADSNLSVQKFLEQKHPEITLKVFQGFCPVDLWQSRYEYKLRSEDDWKALIDGFKLTTQSVQDFCSENDISLEAFRNHCPQDLWKARYEYSRNPETNVNWKEMVSLFMSPELKDKSVQEFCEEQGLSIEGFRQALPPEVWKTRYEYKKLVNFDWDAAIERMKASGKSWQAFCAAEHLKANTFRKNCPDSVLTEYDMYRMKDVERARKFDPSKSLGENADIVGMSYNNMSVFVRNKLEALDPEKFKAFQESKIKKDEKDLRIEELEGLLESAKRQIEELRKENSDLKETIRKKESEISSKEVSIATLRGEKQVAFQKVEQLKNKVRETMRNLNSVIL